MPPTVAGLSTTPDVLEARLAQAGAHQQAAEAAADDRELDLVEDRLAREARLDVGVVDVVGELGLDLDVLLVAVVAQPLVALGEVFRVQRVGIEVDLADDGGEFGCEVHDGSLREPQGGTSRTWRQRNSIASLNIGGPGRTLNLQPDRYERPALTIELRARPAARRATYVLFYAQRQHLRAFRPAMLAPPVRIRHAANAPYFNGGLRPSARSSPDPGPHERLRPMNRLAATLLASSLLAGCAAVPAADRPDACRPTRCRR